MRNLLISSLLALITLGSFSQENLNLNNVLVIAQQDKLEDRYTLEIAMLELMRSNDIVAKSSLNLLKQGQDPSVLASDSVSRKLANDGIDTYLLISVRGYDTRFNPSQNLPELKEELRSGHLFPLWRESASTVTFTFLFYRNGIPAHYELIRVRAGASKDAMMKKLYRKVEKRLQKKWK